MKTWFADLRHLFVSFLSLSLVATLGSCQSKTNSNQTESYQYSLEKGDDLVFSLDSEVSQQTNLIQFIDEADKLVFYNQPLHNICIYDAESGNIVQKINLLKEGPNAINEVTATYRKNVDSTYIFSHWKNLINMVNDQGQIVESIQLPDFKSVEINGVKAPAVYPTSYAPFRSIGENTFVLCGMYGKMEEGKNYTNYSPMIMYDYKTGSMELPCSYPSVYGDYRGGGWGVFTYQVPSYTFDSRSNLIVSFFADDSITVCNMKDNRISIHYAGSSKQTTIKPLPENASKIDHTNHYIAQTQNACIYYDKYRDLYYRIISHPLTDFNINDPQSQSKETVSVVILDSDFNKVGEEFAIDKTPFFASCFVSKRGFHIKKASDNDDYMVFMTLKAEKK